MFRQNGHRRQGHCGNSLAGGLDPHSTEKDVSDCAPVDLCNQGSKYGAFVAQGIHKIGFIGPAKSRFID